MLFALVSMVAGQSCNFFPFIDGCSHSPNFIKQLMSQACVRHDLCYGCVSSYKRNQNSRIIVKFNIFYRLLIVELHV